MKHHNYLIAGVILLVLLGTFLIIGITSSRMVMMDFLKDEARALLSFISLAQENSLFAEGKLEDQIIEKLISIVKYLDETDFDRSNLDRLRQDFLLSSIAVIDPSSGKILRKSGSPVEVPGDFLISKDKIFFRYFTLAEAKNIRFMYRLGNRVIQIELTADEVTRFSSQYGISKILNQIAANPMIRYLVLQDPKGIIFATPNVKSLSRIESDSTLLDALDKKAEVTRIAKFEDRDILEIVQPFTIDGKVIGLFRIGMSLESYHEHMRRTYTQLLIIFVLLLIAGFFIFFFFIRYQSYLSLDEYFSKTLGAIDEGFILVDARGKISGVNRMFCAIAGMPEQVLLRNDYDQLFASDPFSIKIAWSNRSLVEEEKKLFDKTINYTTHPLFDRRNKVTGTITILHDVTKIREFEKEREEKERLSFLGNLVANFAHEIKNPLNGLSIAAQRLSKEFLIQDEDYHFLTRTLTKEIEALNRVLNDFLSLVRPKIKEKHTFDLSTLVTEAVLLANEQAKQRRINIARSIAGNVRCHGNADDLKRAVFNILLNAIEALGGLPEGKGEIEVSLKEAAGGIELKVSDNGPGIPEDVREEIFQPYFTTKQGGTGLGLYIAQKIVKENGGKISVESSTGKGTAFVIGFPSGNG